ncbi:response regulator [Sphingobacterium sp. UBA5996]|uniref:response regulator n=1 Tax=Sphingobacterium sp. UBA5996 TaxID=1947505 RepID=UPI0025E381CF|nr:response regulator [Sphingobacterium sp. UBA5996]
MKLNYKIIWVEDKIETKPFSSLRKSIQDYLEEEFFDVQLDIAEDFDEFKKQYKDNQTYDLIITDLNLNESHGNQVIDYIRDEKHALTEIFFYSANSELFTTKLANSSRITFYQLDGQDYHKNLLSSVLEVIRITISKFQHIISMRGMIMHETSSLDIKMEEIVRKQLLNPNLEQEIQPVLTSIFDNIFKNAQEKYKKAEARKAKDILRDNVLFNSSQKVFALGAILDIMKEDNFANKYNEEVILIRNQFAHCELQMSIDGTEYFKIKDKEVKFDKDLCKKIRKDLNSFRLKLNAIEELIT